MKLEEQTLKIITEENYNIKNEETHNIDGEIYNDLLIDKKYIIEMNKKIYNEKRIYYMHVEYSDTKFYCISNTK